MMSDTGFQIQDTGLTCIMYLASPIISREINPFRVFGDVGRAHDV